MLTTRANLKAGVQHRNGARPSASFPLNAARYHVTQQHGLQQRCVMTCAKARRSTRGSGGSADKADPEKVVDEQQAAKEKAFNDAMNEINDKFGKGSLMKLGAAPRLVETTPSGCLTLDLALGGGYPKGRIVEIFGPESSGKTTLALHAVAEVQKRNGKAVFIDAEHAFDPVYAKSLGVNIDDLYLTQPDSGEMALEVADYMARAGANIIAIDSVAALTPRAEIEGEMGMPQIGLQARLMSHALRKLTTSAAKSGCTLIFLNQLRYKIGVMYGNPETTSGGNALKFYASVRVDVRNKSKIEQGDKSVGIHVKAKIVKNKVAPPYRFAEFDVLFGSGIHALGCVVDAAEGCGILTRRGSWYCISGEGDNIGQGREKVIENLKGNPELAKRIEDLTREKLKSSALPDTDVAAKGADEDDLEEEVFLDE